jgi:general secretion pathway protein D
MRFHPSLNSCRLLSVSLLIPVFAVLAGPAGAQPVPTHPGNASSMPVPSKDSSRILTGPMPTPASEGQLRPSPMPGTQADGTPSTTSLMAPSAADTSGTVGPLKFGDLTVDAALDLLEQWTGRIVLRPQSLPATSLVLSIPHPIPKAEAVQALDTLLTINQIAVAPMGDKFLKVTPLAQIRSEAPELIEGSTLGLPVSGRVAVKLFEFKYLTASEFMPQLATLLSPGIGAAPVVVDKANAALVTDTISNLQRIEKLIAELDHPSLTKLTPHFYSLTNAKASDVANSIRTLIGGSLAPQIGTSVTIQPDDRTNQIIVLCDARQQPFFDELIDKLNSKGETNTRQEVIRLKHAVSKDVATLLTQLVAGRKQATTSGTGQPGAQQPASPRRPAAGANPAAPGGAVTPANAVATALQSISNEGAVTEFSSLLTILSDDRSNSLVVSGTVDDINIVRELVSKIDILLAQVRIEALICEVSLTDNSQTGIGALGLLVSGGRLVGFNGTLGPTSNPSATIGGAPVTVNGTTTTSTYATFGAGYELSAALGLNATPRKDYVTVLQAPTIVTTHNQEATIFVGESLPIITNFLDTGTSGTTNTGVGSSAFNSTVSYKDVGVQLKVKPLIGQDGAIELQISTEVNDVLGSVGIGGNSQPTITKRTTESFISAHDGDIIVLGGLQTRKDEHHTSRLGPIPLIGDLFGARSKTVVRDDLVFFLRPYILTNTPADTDKILDRMEQGKQGSEMRKILGTDQPPPKSP